MGVHCSTDERLVDIERLPTKKPRNISKVHNIPFSWADDYVPGEDYETCSTPTDITNSSYRLRRKASKHRSRAVFSALDQLVSSSDEEAGTYTGSSKMSCCSPSSTLTSNRSAYHRTESRSVQSSNSHSFYYPASMTSTTVQSDDEQEREFDLSTLKEPAYPYDLFEPQGLAPERPSRMKYRRSRRKSGSRDHSRGPSLISLEDGR